MSRISELLEGISVEDILEREHVDYRLQNGSSGEQINIRECPFCWGDSWKVYVNRDNGLGNCFHGDCQATFNTFKLAKALIGATRAHEVALYLGDLAREIGWRAPEKPKERKAAEVDTKVEWEIPRSIAVPTKDGQNLRYLEDRGIDNGLTAEFHLRYARKAWFSYAKEDGQPGYMPFKERVIIPVFDLDGKLVTFQGRDLTGKAQSKYLFPPTLPGTGKFLYNGQNVGQCETIVIAEGAFDVIGATKAIRRSSVVAITDYGVVGTFGKHLSTGNDGDDQLSRLLRLKHARLRRIIIMWDGDRDSYLRAVAAAVMLRKHGFKTAVAALPKDKDPGDATELEIERALRTARWIRTDADAILMRVMTPYDH